MKNDRTTWRDSSCWEMEEYEICQENQALGPILHLARKAWALPPTQGVQFKGETTVMA